MTAVTHVSLLDNLGAVAVRRSVRSVQKASLKVSRSVLTLRSYGSGLFSGAIHRFTWWDRKGKASTVWSLELTSQERGAMLRSVRTLVRRVRRAGNVTRQRIGGHRLDHGERSRFQSP